jgi:hypothetical protein
MFDPLRDDPRFQNLITGATSEPGPLGQP